MYCSVLALGCNVNTIRMSQPDIESIFNCLSHKKSMKYSGHRKLFCELLKFSKFYAFISSCLQIPPRENWFQYVRRKYWTAINFPYIIYYLGQVKLKGTVHVVSSGIPNIQQCLTRGLLEITRPALLKGLSTNLFMTLFI